MLLPTTPAVPPTIPQVPFYSQFKDIVSPTWQKAGCGITSLAMVINYYAPDTVTVNSLLKQGLAAGAFISNVGWSYKGLISVSQNYGLDGSSYDFGKSAGSVALAELKGYVQDGPVIASIHYKFDPKSTIPHLIVIDGIASSTVYYNDPAAKSGELTISTDNFLKGWKKRFIVIRPTKLAVATSTTHAE